MKTFTMLVAFSLCHCLCYGHKRYYGKLNRKLSRLKSVFSRNVRQLKREILTQAEIHRNESFTGPQLNVITDETLVKLREEISRVFGEMTNTSTGDTKSGHAAALIHMEPIIPSNINITVVRDAIKSQMESTEMMYSDISLRAYSIMVYCVRETHIRYIRKYVDSCACSNGTDLN